jgi:hypothetical protein
MSWIQENRFAAGLGGITAVAAAGLIVWAVSAGKGYTKAKEEYDTTAQEVEKMVKGPLYPNEDNLSAKEKAVKDYKESVASLEKAFDKFRAPTPPNIEPGEFNDAIRKALDAATKAITDAKGEVPAEFFIGFEAYREAPARKEATGILSYQLEAVSNLFAGLAASGPAKVLNTYRPLLEEEEGKVFDVKGKSFRALPFEIAFSGKEETFRKFLSSLDDSGKYYYVIRSIRVVNEKLKAPTSADGQFKTEEAASDAGAATAAPGADPFGGAAAGGFVLPGDDAGTPPPADAAAPAPAPDPASPAAGGSGVILQEVLGAEKINVFLRLDIIQFLDQAPQAAKKQP